MDPLHPGHQLDPDEEDGLGGEGAAALVEELLEAVPGVRVLPLGLVPAAPAPAG